VAEPRLTVVADRRFLNYDFGPGHPWDPTSRWLASRLLEAWETEGRLATPLRWIREAPLATGHELQRFHTAAYLATVREADLRGLGELLDRGDTPSFPGCFDAAARVVGGTLAALGAISDGTTRRAFQPSGGLHHSAPGAASGFCIFNDVAVAIRTALEGRFRRVAYVDIDVHHGDGVMYGFYDDGHVLDIDFHETGRVLFPGTGEVVETGRGDGAGLKVNVPLPPGVGDDAFLPLFRAIVPTMIRSYRPELIVLQHGVDAHAGDGLGHLRYTSRSYLGALATVEALAEEVAGGRLLVTGGGGYNARNVAVVLAGAGASLASVEEPGSIPGPTPAAWREEFRELTGGAAPESAEPGHAPRSSDWSEEHAARLVAALEQALGVRLGAGR
jgi:acetoin utilization protein AcuC